jgi:hypothetical protein
MSLPFTMTAAEMVETVVMCYLRNRTTEGRCGKLVHLEDGSYRVTVADDIGRTFIVACTKTGWRVTFKATAVEDRELYVAAADALKHGEAYDVSRHHNGLPGSLSD